MQRNSEDDNTECTEVVCNRCGKVLRQEKGILFEDFLHVEKTWGYFSSRDGSRQVWDICEACYNDVTSQFKYPAEEEAYTEFV